MTFFVLLATYKRQCSESNFYLRYFRLFITLRELIDARIEMLSKANSESHYVAQLRKESKIKYGKF